tara:strand:+ start:2661 stop:3542 length:882 start_codon:yes stop_codon:yes gene_type:complete
MRIAHVTDIHVLVPPRLSQLFGKRLLGTLNLYVFGRKSHFSEAAQEALVRDVMACEPDALICTGDLTAQATPEEFRAAFELLQPLFQRQPTVLIPGNHDTYTLSAWKGLLIEKDFSSWLGTGDWPRTHILSPDLSVVCVDVCRAHVLSTGRVDEAQLRELDVVLRKEAEAGRKVIIAMHYPLRDRHGNPYGAKTHNIDNGPDIENCLSAYGETIIAMVHGHVHHGYQTMVPTQFGSFPSLNPGASGYAHLPKLKRTGHFSVYTVESDSISVERYAFDGTSFVPEDGGAYATGR